jgi:hypothetical protein
MPLRWAVLLPEGSERNARFGPTMFSTLVCLLAPLRY